MNPFDDERHVRSDILATQAASLRRKGAVDEARHLYREAARCESAVAREIPSDSPRMASIFAVSATSLWFHASAYDQGEQEAAWFLAKAGGLTKQARQELYGLLRRCHIEKSLLDHFGSVDAFAPLELRLTGSAVGYGFAPSQQIQYRHQVATGLLLQTQRLKQERKYQPLSLTKNWQRDTALPVLAAPAMEGSYGILLYLCKRDATKARFEEAAHSPSAIVSTFLDIASSVQHGLDSLTKLISEPKYAGEFLRGFRDLTPDGGQIGELRCFSAPLIHSTPQAMFGPSDRDMLTRTIGDQLRRRFEDAPVVGVLRNVKLESRRPSIGIRTNDDQTIRVLMRPSEFDERLRVLLNRNVSALVEAKASRKGHVEFYLKSIEAAER